MLNGRDVRRTPVPLLARHAGLVFQDPESQFLMTSVRKEIAFGLENLGLPRAEMKDRINWILEVVGMQGVEDRSPYHLSGGQEQRMAIASVLAMQPELLVLDEPTANLDPAGTDDLYDLIDRMRRTLEMSILMISNDSEFLAERADRILVLAEGVLALQGAPNVLFARIQELAELGLAAPQLTRLAHYLGEGLGTSMRFTTLDGAVRRLTPLLESAVRRGGP